MKRNEIVKSLLKEGFSEKTLVNFSDRQLLTLASRMLGEADIMISKKDPLANQKITDAKKQNKSIETYEEEMKESSKKKPSSGLSKEKKSETVKKAKKGEDIGKKGKGFEKIVKKAKESGAEDPEAVAASAMWKNIKREGVEIKNWVKQITNENFHSFTSKNEIMDMIQFKMNEQEVGSKVKKGHNGIPEFMSYDVITSTETIDAEPITKPAPTKPKTLPGTKPRTPYQPGPGTNPKPKALKETK
jgi:hypothetical protein